LLRYTGAIGGFTGYGLAKIQVGRIDSVKMTCYEQRDGGGC